MEWLYWVAGLVRSATLCFESESVRSANCCFVTVSSGCSTRSAHGSDRLKPGLQPRNHAVKTQSCSVTLTAWSWSRGGTRDGLAQGTVHPRREVGGPRCARPTLRRKPGVLMELMAPHRDKGGTRF